MPLASNTAIPLHVGIIMDGNGRWAKSQKKARTFGHSEGLKAAKKAVQFAADHGIRYLTLYTFSTENWKRTQEEVGFLFSLIGKHLKNEMNFYRKNEVQVRFCGNLEPLPSALKKEILEVVEETAHFNQLTVTLAINYGGRDEILRAINRALKAKEENITAQTLQQYLDNPDIPDPDLIIRTAGELRLSNFLLWEAAYSELYATPVLWPEFKEADFIKALEDYQKRTRKFGGIQ